MGLYFSASSLIIAIILAIVFFTKKKVKNDETEIYGLLLLVIIVTLSFEVMTGSWYVLGISTDNFVYLLLCKMLFTFYVLINTLFTKYLINICEGKKRKNYFLLIAFCLAVIIIFASPIEFKTIRNCISPFGIGILTVFTYCLFFMVYQIVLCIKYRKKIAKQKFTPYYIFLLLGILNFVIIILFPGNFLIGFIFFITILIMYFTIENPDYKLLEEYNKNKELVELNIDEKSNMLFKITEDVEYPIRKINLLSNNIIKSNQINEMHKDAKSIEDISNNVSYMINDVFNLSTLDKQNIKIMSNTYDIYNLFNQIIYIIKSKANNKLEFKYSMSNNIPERMNGDSSKLKQIICSIIFNEIRHTTKGTIDLNIDSIQKNDVCRLIITIENSGRNMNFSEINNILDKDDNISEEEINETDNFDLDLRTVKKTVDLLRGTIFIKSDNTNGLTYTIVINQSIEEDNKKSTIETLSKVLSNKQKVLLVDDDYKELEKYSNQLKSNNYEVTSTMYGKDCINRINDDEIFDIIFLDDEMEDYSAVKVFQELNPEKLKDTKIIVMLEKEKESIKDNYLEDYPFVDYLLKNNYKEEIKRLKQKYK